MTDDKLRARYEVWANAQNPPEGDCSCGLPMDAHSGGMALLHHDYHVVAALAASATDEGPREWHAPRIKHVRDIDAGSYPIIVCTAEGCLATDEDWIEAHAHRPAVPALDAEPVGPTCALCPWDEDIGHEAHARLIHLDADLVVVEQMGRKFIVARPAVPAALDVERLARAIRQAELRSQMDAEKLGAVPAETGPMPDWYRAYAADVAREYAVSHLRRAR